MLQNFVSHKDSRSCNLSEANVLAIRIYSTSSYGQLNVPLRNRLFVPCAIVPGKKRFLPHPFKLTVYYLATGLRQLRVGAVQRGSDDFGSTVLHYRCERERVRAYARLGLARSVYILSRTMYWLLTILSPASGGYTVLSSIRSK